MSLRMLKNLFQRRTPVVLLVQYPLIAIALFAVWWLFGRFYLAIGIVFVALVLLVTVVTNRKPAKNVVNIAQGNWRRYIETLLYQGYDRAFMMVEARGPKRPLQFGNLTFTYEAPATTHFMQFTKCITENGVTLQLQFARAPWSLEYYDQLQELLKQREYYYDLWPVRPGDKFSPEIDQFIVVSLGQDVEHSAVLTKLILVEIFKLKPSDTVLVWYGNINPNKNRKIGF